MNTSLPNLRHLQLLLGVLRRGSISEVARAAHLSQPAVTQAIAAVESWFGGELLWRSSGGMRASGAGVAAAARIERALALLQEGLSGARAGLRDITSAQLLAFLQLAGHDSFAAAAAHRGLSRATLHRAVRQLESRLGVALVDHSSGRLVLTREGERLLQRTQLAVAEMAQARDEFAHSFGHGGGSTVIGAMPLARSALVPRAVLAFAEEQPAHALGILEGPYDTLLSALRRGDADFLVGALRSPLAASDVQQEHLFDDPLSLIVRAGHPLTAVRTPGLAQLGRHAWIAPRVESPLRRQFELLRRKLGEPAPAAPIECNSLSAARALLLGSDRVMLLSRHQVHHELSSGQLVALPHPLGPAFRAIGMTFRRNWQPTPAQARLLTILREKAGELAAI